MINDESGAVGLRLRRSSQVKPLRLAIQGIEVEDVLRLA